MHSLENQKSLGAECSENQSTSLKEYMQSPKKVRGKVKYKCHQGSYGLSPSFLKCFVLAETIETESTTELMEEVKYIF